MSPLEYLFFFLFFLLVYTYLLYPWYAIRKAKKVQNDGLIFGKGELPHVAILMSAFNEDRIIEKKLTSVYDTDYPLDRIHFFVGSDDSTDNTDEILKAFENRYDNFNFRAFKQRRGKANVINALMEELPEHIDYVILTDANVLFTRDCLYEMIKPFKDEKVGQVGANVINYDVSSEDIGAEEEFYIGRENRLKNAEGKLWGASMGAFGACYAIRRKLIPPIPNNFLMEDFYISLNVLDKGYDALLSLDARVLEDIPGTLSQEFKRKKRISAGNFQNLNHYFIRFCKKFWPQGFVFLSHKVLRWIGPMIMLLMAAILIFRATVNPLFTGMLYCSMVLIALVLLDGLFQGKGIYFRPIRALRYFLMMNIALLLGFFDFLKGVKSNAWQPTIRK